MVEKERVYTKFSDNFTTNLPFFQEFYPLFPRLVQFFRCFLLHVDALGAEVRAANGARVCPTLLQKLFRREHDFWRCSLQIAGYIWEIAVPSRTG